MPPHSFFRLYPAILFSASCILQSCDRFVHAAATCTYRKSQPTRQHRGALKLKTSCISNKCSFGDHQKPKMVMEDGHRSQRLFGKLVGTFWWTKTDFLLALVVGTPWPLTIHHHRVLNKPKNSPVSTDRKRVVARGKARSLGLLCERTPRKISVAFLL